MFCAAARQAGKASTPVDELMNLAEKEALRPLPSSFSFYFSRYSSIRKEKMPIHLSGDKKITPLHFCFLNFFCFYHV